MYIYHALINALSAHMIHINLNMIFYTHVKHSPTKTIYNESNVMVHRNNESNVKTHRNNESNVMAYNNNNNNNNNNK